jgi:competence protein ComEC
VGQALLRGLDARPLLGLAAAIVLGSAAGAGLPGALDLARASVVAALLVWALVLALRCDARLARLGLFAACAAVALLRAASERVTEAEATAAPVQSGPFAGTTTSEGVSARLGASTRIWTVPAGVCAAGEQVVVDPVHEPAEWARGEEPGPRRAAGVRPGVDLVPDEIARLSRAPPSLSGSLASAASSLRSALAARTASIRDPTTRALVLALLFGDTSALAPELPDLFVRTGTFHVLAVSGMQVVLVLCFLIGPASAGCAWLARRATRGRLRPAREWFTLPALLLFVPIAGGGAPIVRSALGAAFGLIAPHLSAERAAVVEARGRRVHVRLARRADALSCWALALILECALHPLATTSLSVQLSYGRDLGLIAGTGPFLALVARLAGGGSARARGWCAPLSRTGRPRSPWLVVGIDRAAHAACCAVAASSAAVVATLPFVWERLGECSPWGVFATPALGAPTALLFVGGWLRVLWAPLVPDAFLDLCARAMVASMQLFDLLPGTPEPLPPRSAWLVAAACALTFVALRRGLASGPGRVAALAWAIVLVPASPTSARVEVRALDVGAGTAVVLEGPGLGTWVFDAGSRDRQDVAREALGPLLRRLDPGTIGVVLSHADRDHDGALGWLVERYPPRCFAGALPARLVERLPHDSARLALETGALRLAGGADTALVLERALPGLASDNEASYALLLEARGERALFFGDAEERGLDAWLAHARPARPTRLVLWPHHGSESDRLDALVRATRPAEVWISAAGRPPASRELERRAIETKCTARDGPLFLRLPSGTKDARRSRHDRRAGFSPSPATIRWRPLWSGASCTSLTARACVSRRASSKAASKCARATVGAASPPPACRRPGSSATSCARPARASTRSRPTPSGCASRRCAG